MYRKDTMKEFIDDKKRQNYYIVTKLVRGVYYNLDEKTGNLFLKKIIHI